MIDPVSMEIVGSALLLLAGLAYTAARLLRAAARKRRRG